MAGSGNSTKANSNKSKTGSGRKSSATAKASASKSGTGRSTGARKTSTARKSTKRTSKKGVVSNPLKDEIVILIALACSLILLLSNFNLAGSVGAWIKWFMFGLIGIMEYLFPIILAATLIFMVSNKDMLAVAKVKSAAVYALVIVLSAFVMRITDNPPIKDTSMGEFFEICADEKIGGGLFGGLLCKIMSPMGTVGTFVVLLILAIICIIIITERSFISGIMDMKSGGQRMIKAARQDYDMYMEHASDRAALRQAIQDEYDTESDEEYLARRKREKELKNQERLKREQEILEKKEQRVKERISRKARGVTLDTELPRENIAPNSVDIHEIITDVGRDIDTTDHYSQDIYEPEEIHPLDELSAEDVNMNIHEVQEYEQIHSQDTYEAEKYEPDYQDDSIDLYGDNQDMPVQDIRVEKPESHTDSRTDRIESLAVVNSSGMPEIESGAGKESGTGSPLAGNIPVEKHAAKKTNYIFPPVSLLARGSARKGANQAVENQNTALRLQQTLQNFGVKVTITDISCGPSVTRYELSPEQGVKVSKIVSLADDIKLNLAAADIRIEAPIPGKSAIGIEVPNKEPGSVHFRELIESDAFKNAPSNIAFAAGKDIAGKTIVADIAKMPHLLIAGATGSGKSVCINTIIMSILYKAHPDDVKLILVDPKVVELSVYNGIPHLLTPVVTDPKKASSALNWAVAEMTVRYNKFAQMNVRDLKGYNAKVEKLMAAENTGVEPPEKMPQIVIVIDELADLMMVAPGEVEDAICRLAQLARAAGIHLVIATQRPSVNVITGIIKANIPSRIAFSVSSGVDSRTIIDMNGAEKLLGKGDMLFFPSGYPKPVRVQGAFVSDEEVGKVVDFLKANMGEEVVYDEEVTNSITSMESSSGAKETESDRDQLFAEAGRFVIEKEKGSIGMLQRYFKIGFNRAGRIMDQLADAGVVGPEIGTKPRKIIMTTEEFEDFLKNNNI